MAPEFASNISASGDEVVCIVGMHRSGTSLIAQLLKQSGLYLGSEESLLGSNVGNQDGHFEHVEFIDLNDSLLQHLGGSWEHPPELPSGWEKAASLEPLRCRAREFLGGFAGKSPWGWKDPRTTLLLPFWRSLIPNLRFIVCVRSPLAVANSLEARDKIPLARGAYLWDRYLRAAFADTEGCRRLVVFYDRYFINPAEEVARLIDFCGLPRPVQATALAAAVRDDLRHQRSDVAALLACDLISRESKLLYLGLRGLESAGEEFGPREAGSGNSVVELLRMLEDSPQHQLLAGLQSRLNRTELALANLHAEIWRDTKANHRWAYRFYRKVLRPFHIARFRATHKDFR